MKSFDSIDEREQCRRGLCRDAIKRSVAPRGFTGMSIIGQGSLEKSAVWSVSSEKRDFSKSRVSAKSTTRTDLFISLLGPIQFFWLD